MHSHGDDLRASLNRFFFTGFSSLACLFRHTSDNWKIYISDNETRDSPEFTYMARNVIAEIDSLYYAYIITIAMDAAMSYRYKKELHRFNYHFVEPLRRIQVRALCEFIAFVFTFLIMRALFLIACIHIAAFIDIVMFYP